MTKRKPRLSLISTLHYIKLCFRSILFLAALIAYIVSRIQNTDASFGELANRSILLAFIGVVFVTEMTLRFFPSKLESMGCQKQFSQNYIPTNRKRSSPRSWKPTAAIAAAWLALNAVIGMLYFIGLIDEAILILISLAFSVCDMICILFFCPFQTWFMKNKCCSSCRIYNWDYAMMFTPLVFIPHYYTWGLLGIALLLLGHWEITIRRHPERFAVETNASLTCANCKEKLCQHKKQLQHLLKKYGRDLQNKLNHRL